MFRLRSLGILLVALLAACGPQQQSGEQPVGDLPDALTAAEDKDFNGLKFTLSEADPGASQAASPMKVVEGTALDSARVKALLTAMGPAPTADTEEFALRGGTLPPPRAGKTVKTSFPPTGDREKGPEPPEAKELEVVRHMPEGEVPIAPKLTITFSQPMVAVTSHDDAAKNIPVNIEPQPEGNWRWVGTKTLVFEPAGERFPMASRYEVTVPAGTKSALGKELKEAHSFSFATPPVQVEFWAPGNYDPIGQEQVMLFQANQRIDANILEYLELKGGGKSWALNRVDKDAVQADPLLQYYTAQLKDDRWIAVKPAERLPLETSVELVLQKGAPSAEGPLPTQWDQSYNMQVHGAMEVVNHRCGYDECRPWDSFEIELSNPMDREAFDEEWVVVEPSIPNDQISVYGRHINIYGQTEGRTTYKVTVKKGLKDVFGGAMQADETVEFEVGDPRPNISGPGWATTVLDPASDPIYSVYSTGFDELQVRMYSVDPSDYQAYTEFRNEYAYGGLKRIITPMPGKEVKQWTIPVEDGGSGKQVETEIDVSAALDGKYGHVALVIEPTEPPEDDYYRPVVIAWVQRTELSLTAYTDPTGVIPWVTRIADGSPVKGVEVMAVSPESKKTTTKADGLARIDNTGKQHVALVASQADDTALLPWVNYYTAVTGPPLAWYVMDDRKMYRPGETVHVKGWIRQWNKEQTVLSRLGAKGATIKWKATDGYGNEIDDGTAKVEGLDGFDLEFSIPDNVNLGYAYVSLELQGLDGRSQTAYSHNFQIQEFRRPEFEVSTNVSEGPHIVGESLEVELSANYYTGGALPDAQVSWSAYAFPAYYSPPNRTDYRFGHQMYWWGYNPGRNAESQELTSQTDANGKHRLSVDLEGVNPARTMSLTTSGSVIDVNRQSWASTENIVVHPSSLYVGIDPDKLFVEQDEPARFDLIVTDINGEIVPNVAIDMDAAFMEWKEVDGRWQQVPSEDEEPKRCVKSSSKDPVSCEFSFSSGGNYRIRARIADAEGRVNSTIINLWVAGGDRPTDRQLKQEELTLVPDGDSYKPGDTARVLVTAPFSPAEGFVTVRRASIVSTQRFRMEESSKTLEIPVVDAHMSGIQVRVDILGSAERVDDAGEPRPDLPRRPAFATGTAQLAVSAESRRLTVTPSPSSEVVAPGEKTSVDVLVEDADGNPVSDAEVTLVVVDESILALSNYQVADPITAFYGFSWPQVQQQFLLSHMVLANADQLPAGSAASATGASRDGRLVDETTTREEFGRGGGGLALEQQAFGVAGGDADVANGEMDSGLMAKSEDKAAGKRARAPSPRPQKGQAGPVAALRKNFDALAVFEPAVVTDSRGRTTVEFSMPDSLTRYRVIALAAAGDNQFGTGESGITARMPLMVRPSAPRFLNTGDTMELPIVVQNPSDSDVTVDVAVRAANLELDTAGRQVQVPAKDRVEVRFPASTQKPGKATIQVVIATPDDKDTDAAEVTLPVWTPATTEAFAVYGEIDKGAIRQPVALPSSVAPQFGGLEVTTSSTALHALTDAVLYLVRYKFECTEQMSSRLLAIASLRDVLAAFEAEGLPEPEELEETAARDIEMLTGRQNYDGGFPWWRYGQQSSPWLTVHTTHALVRAQQKGYDVPERSMNMAMQYLQNIENYIPVWYSEQMRQAIKAYSYYVRERNGEKAHDEAREILADHELDDLSLETSGWLLAVLADDSSAKSELKEIRQHLNNRASEEAGTAHFAAAYSDGDHVLLHSSRRTDAVILDGLMRDDPKNDLIPKIVRGLLAHRVKGRWLNTQENAFVLVALYEYFEQYEKKSPDFVARVWLGDDYAGDYAYEKRSTDRHRIDIPMSWLAKQKKADLIVQKDGKDGRLYYRVGMRYAPENLELEPKDHGFAVERVYEPVDNDDDVHRDDKGVWHIKAGAKVRVRLSMFTSDRRYHVALVDPLAAGLEAMNPALAVTGNVPQDPNRQNANNFWWGYYTWYEHQNMRDERVEAFSRLVWEGVWDYSYVARATTPGRFVVPPPKAEEMYHPETFGRGATDIVVVE